MTFGQSRQGWSSLQCGGGRSESRVTVLVVVQEMPWGRDTAGRPAPSAVKPRALVPPQLTCSNKEMTRRPMCMRAGHLFRAAVCLVSSHRPVLTLCRSATHTTAKEMTCRQIRYVSSSLHSAAVKQRALVPGNSQPTTRSRDGDGICRTAQPKR